MYEKAYPADFSRFRSFESDLAINLSYFIMQYGGLLFHLCIENMRTMMLAIGAVKLMSVIRSNK